MHAIHDKFNSTLKFMNANSWKTLCNSAFIIWMALLFFFFFYPRVWKMYNILLIIWITYEFYFVDDFNPVVGCLNHVNECTGMQRKQFFILVKIILNDARETYTPSNASSMRFMSCDVGGQGICWNYPKYSLNHSILTRWHGALSSWKTPSLFWYMKSMNGWEWSPGSWT